MNKKQNMKSFYKQNRIKKNKDKNSLINKIFFFRYKKSLVIAFSIMVATSICLSFILNTKDNTDTANNESLTISEESTRFYKMLISDNALLSSGNSIPLKYDEYEVIAGDNTSFIAKNTGASLDTIISVNKLTNAHLITPGKVLKIPNRDGLLYTVKKEDTTIENIADKYGISLSTVLKVNEIKNKNNIEIDTEIFLPGARYTIEERVALYGLSFFTPLYHYRISSRYGYRSDPFNKKRALHKGTDMAAPQGTPILAARGGTIVFSGYSGGYGLLVIIKHDSEYSTYYGHMYKSYVKSGQKVAMSQTIGEVGQTGRVTGPHLHFEIRKHGSPVDPKFHVSLKQ